MPLREELESNGNWLFRRRSWLPLVLYVFALAVMLLYPAKTHHCMTVAHWGIICLAISLSGLLVRAFTVGYTPKGTSGRNTTAGQVAESLNQIGIYSIVRHPLYLGNYLMWLGLFLFPGLWWFAAICSLAYWIYYERIMFAEEEFLRKSYSVKYESWASRTPAFIPKFSGWLPNQVNFSLKNVLKREYNGFFATLFSFAALNAISYLIAEHRFYMDQVWIYILGFGIIVFLVLRFLRKSTKILDEEGR